MPEQPVLAGRSSTILGAYGALPLVVRRTTTGEAVMLVDRRRPEVRTKTGELVRRAAARVHATAWRIGAGGTKTNTSRESP